jgi:Ca2+-binding RTX toxin-like protein
MVSRYDSMSFVGTDAAEQLRAVTRVEGVSATMKGGDDVVVGTPWDDRIDAGPGNDRVDALGGTDTCLEAEQVTGCEQTQPPSDTCAGQAPTIVASGTNLPVLGTSGPDVILGSDRNDVIDALGGDDVICGLEGADVVDAGPGNDRIYGGGDGTDDTLLVGDRVLPGSGDDQVDLGYDTRRESGDYDAVYSSRDALDYTSSATGITADLTPVGGAFVVTGEGTDTVAAQPLLELRGSPLDDTVTGSAGGDRILGMGGDDVLDGAGGDDFLYGEDDCERVECVSGAPDHDVLRGGDGDDTLGTAQGLDDLDGGVGDDELTGKAYHGARSLLGGEGDDSVTLGLRGSTKVELDGGPGDDTLLVQAGGARLDGGVLVVDAARSMLVSGDVGAAATMRSFSSYTLVSFFRNRLRDLRFRFIGSDSPEKVAVWNGKGRLRAWTRGGDDVVRGSNMDDFVDGGEGFDRVHMLGGVDRCVDVEVAHGCEPSP